ncbi:MAG: hypothetical protein IJC17_06270 [Clostridia bacterium]|nr:hypothetical protein [Clostridia bacterium]
MNNFLKTFKNPPREYSMAPFWFLNDDLDPDHLRYQLDEMAAKGVYECVLHARKGLTVPYLSEEWFDRIGVILEKAQALGMRVWIYDEDNWPSGYAGGRVVASNPDFAAECLTLDKIVPVLGKPLVIPDVPGKRLERVVAVHRNEEFFDITGQEWASPELQYEVYVFRSEKNKHHPAYSDQPYINLMNKDAVAKFIEVTHAEYKKRFPKHWGTTIKGFFTDEPGFYQNYLYQTYNLNTIPWCADFSDYFKKIKGYDIMLYLCSLWDDMGELSHKTRIDYFDVMTKLYNESFFKQLQDFLSADGLVSIGHLHQEEHFNNTVQMEGDFFADMQYLDYAGIDRIDRERERVTEKLGSSAMHLQNKKFCFSETYGCFGWGLTMDEIKRELDWQYVQGVNKMVPHAFFSSIEGFRVNECPPSFFTQNPFWPYFKKFADYTTRLSYALSEGDFAANVLVYYPIKSCWKEFQPLDTHKIRLLDDAFIRTSHYLLTHQIDFDFVDDDSLVSAKQEGDQLHIHRTAYKAVIVPPITYLPPETEQALLAFAKNGGLVIDLSDSGLLDHLPTRHSLSLADLPAFSADHELADLRLLLPSEHFKYQHRRVEGGELYFITGESDEEALLTAELKAAGTCYRLDPVTGDATPFETVQQGDRTVITYRMQPSESLLLYFLDTPSQEIPLENWEVVLPDGKTVKTPPCTFDKLGLETYSGAVEYRATFSATGGQLTLDLGDVREIAEVIVNGTAVDTLLWKPYRLNIGGYTVMGENTLSIKVSNTPANALTAHHPLSGLASTPHLWIEK